MFKIANRAMAVLFVFGAAVQYNDPDPWRWIAIYLAAAGVSLIADRRPAGAALPALAVGVIALVWGETTSLSVQGRDVYTHMFDAWEMRAPGVEEAREVSGLFIIGVWMAAIALGRRRPRGATASA